MIRRLILLVVVAGVAYGGYAFQQALKSKNADIWFWNALFAPRPPQVDGPVHIMFMTVDHWEPKVYAPARETERARVERWRLEYPPLADAHRDADGRKPQHTFSYPADEFDGPTMEMLSDLVFRGYGEIELQLHHVDDTEDTVRAKFEEALDVYPRYGALITLEPEPRKTFGLVHGNWALDDGRPGWCGVTTELDLLNELGCYGDFTFPAAGHLSQPSQVNDIYYAVDTPERKSYDTGASVRVGESPPERGVMIFQGPLGMDFRNRHGTFRPRIENGGTFYASNPPTPARADFWISRGIHVKGRPEWVFVKTHCHGAEESQMENWFGGPFDELFTYLETRYNDGTDFVLHYVTTREAYNIVKAAEAGETGNPNAYRDYVIPAYANTQIHSNKRYALEQGGQTLALHLLEDGPVTMRFHNRRITAVDGSVARLALHANGGEAWLQGAWQPLVVRSTEKIDSFVGATLTSEPHGDEELEYVLQPNGDAQSVRWSYGATTDTPEAS